MSAIDRRPTSGKLVVPYVVDERVQPVDFKIMHPSHVRKCAERRLCGVCGKPIAHNTPVAFIGPGDDRRCFADPWMHVACAELSMQQCPFLADRRGWREHDEQPVLRQFEDRYEHHMALFVAPDCRSHRDDFGHWHFEALGALRRLS